MHRLVKLFIACSIFSILGCKSKNPNPELIDPIYLDLQKEERRHSQLVKELEKQIETSNKELASSEPRSIDLKIKAKEISGLKDRLIRLKQGEEYFRIRAELRRVEARKAYTIAFEKGEEWPNPEEFKAYEVNKRLRTVPLNWSERVPKLKLLQEEALKEETSGE